MDDAIFDAGRHVTCPLLVLWGAKEATPASSTATSSPIGAPTQRARSPAGPIACGHYVQEEAPEERLGAGWRCSWMRPGG